MNNTAPLIKNPWRHLIAIFCLLAAMTPVVAWAQNDLRYAYPIQPSISPKGVDFQTGRFSYRKTDIKIGPLSLVRSWADASNYRRTNIFGPSLVTGAQNRGWSHNFNQGVTRNSNGDFLSVYADNKRYKFTVGGLGDLYSQDKTSRGAVLRSTSTQYILTNQAGTVFTFVKQNYTALGATSTDAVITRTEYADGSRIDYGYSTGTQPYANFQVHSIISNRGYAIILDHDANGNIAAACGFNTAAQSISNASTCAGAALKVAYAYDTNTQSLISVTDPLGHVVQFIGYGGGPLCITKPDSQLCEIQNIYGTLPTDPFFPGTNVQPIAARPDMVRIQTTATGDVWSYNYDLGENPADVPIVTGRPRYTQSSMISPDDGETVLDYDRGVLVDLSSPEGVFNFKYPQQVLVGRIQPFSFIVFDYHAIEPALVTNAEGNRDYYLYDNRSNVLLHSVWPKGAPAPFTATTNAEMISSTDADLARCCMLPDLPATPAGAISFGQAFLPDYPLGSAFPIGCGAGPADAKRCDKPIARIDERGNQTDYSYDPAHGGILTETAPAVNGVRAQTRYSYAQRYAWVKDSSGGYVQAAAPVWLLTRKSFCKVGAASGAGCALAGDEVVTTYDYGPDAGPNNLLLRGRVEDAGGAALRSCYSYDIWGNKISETKPRAGLVSCS